LVVDCVGRKIPTNIIHVKLIKLRGFGGSEGFFVLGHNICVDLFFIDFAGQHTNNELVHCGVFIAFLKTFKDFDCADEDLTRDDVSSEFNVDFLEVDLVGVDLELLVE